MIGSQRRRGILSNKARYIRIAATLARSVSLLSLVRAVLLQRDLGYVHKKWPDLLLRERGLVMLCASIFSTVRHAAIIAGTIAISDLLAVACLRRLQDAFNLFVWMSERSDLVGLRLLSIGTAYQAARAQSLAAGRSGRARKIALNPHASVREERSNYEEP